MPSMRSSPSLPSYLYHYTSIQGVEGIIKSKAVWATVMHFLNDSKEWLYALDLVRRNLNGRLGQRKGACEKTWV
jgi:hypothetical protein